MKMGYVALTCMLALVTVSMAVPLHGEEELKFDEGEWITPEITHFELSMKNESGNFVLDIYVNGTSPAGTENLELTVGLLNGSRIEAGKFWITDSSSKIFGMGFELRPDGNSTERWSKWYFDAHMEFPMDMDMDLIQRTIETFSDIEIDELGIFENGTLDEVDAEDMVQRLYEANIFIIARSYNSTGSWGQSYLDVTEETRIEVITFLGSEGLIGDDVIDDDDLDVSNDQEEGASKEGSGILIAALGGAATVFLIVIILSVIFILRSRDRK